MKVEDRYQDLKTGLKQVELTEGNYKEIKEFLTNFRRKIK